ncbi:MAG: MetQ/NlpA family ABC transporter substrate-binding protein [Microbacterium sp.]
MKIRTLTGLVVAAALSIGLVACSGSPAAESPSSDAPAQKKEVKVGILSREEPEMRQVADYLATKGYTMKIEVLNDNIAMNRSTADGSLDANWFQHQKYLDSQVKETGVALKSYGPWLMTYATIFVSSKYETFDAMPDGAKIGLSEDAANQSRSLKLLADNGYIELDEKVDLPGVFNVTKNPKNLEFVTSNPRSLTGMFPDLDGMIATSISVYLMKDPSINTLASESAQVAGDYGGLVWVVAKDSKPEDAEWLNLAIEYMESPEWRDWVKEYYGGLKFTP